MPHPPEQKDESRYRIVKSARKLFNRRGFAEVTIDEIMADAGFTRGGFYNHFAAKEELYAEAILQFCRSDSPEQWQTAGVDFARQGPALAREIVNAYLSREHFDDLDGSCPMVGLPSDSARSGKMVRAAYQQILEMMVGAFEETLAPSPEGTRVQALALASMCVGGMVLARAVDDRQLADELREAVRRHAFLTLGC
jgi:AcrR family transcriptional regulator